MSASALEDLGFIAFPILYAMVKRSPNPETLIVKAKSNNHTLTKARVDLVGIAFLILYAMVKSSKNPETLIV